MLIELISPASWIDMRARSATKKAPCSFGNRENCDLLKLPRLTFRHKKILNVFSLSNAEETEPVAGLNRPKKDPKFI